ncbi:glyoxalase [Ligilactobacillus salitolerans]|uniref:Glyoxalase n=1 Tax=Ligilactobacillus salitolerans TaxID=1808352 RepID=A0A401ITM6_9LACO|nr:VOC family protein [Ligilactobacillus salitolerans]GBG94891.1 glyoxalase [Ligilactobacillus salitolerans]
MKVSRIDHLVLPVANVNQAFRFYHEVFDMQELPEQSTAQTITIRCGHQLIYLQQAEVTADLQPAHPVPGAADLCIVVKDKVDDIVNHLKSYFVDIVAGPSERFGSEGKMTSIYVHDLDSNLIEIATYTDR